MEITHIFSGPAKSFTSGLILSGLENLWKYRPDASILDLIKGILARTGLDCTEDQFLEELHNQIGTERAAQEAE
jgi:hypothetical protein